MYPYNMIDPQQFANEQAMLQSRINQLEQQRNQQMGMYSGQSQQMQPQALTSNVNWIQVAGIEGARNQIVQPGHTAWMMDNNNPIFYVKSVDGMGSATFKAFRFTEIQLEAHRMAENQNNSADSDYVTRKEFDALLKRLGELPDEEVSE